jgi:apolipoprotein N-acyltransferase
LALLRDRGPRSRFGLSWLVGVAWFGPSTLWMWTLTAPGWLVAVLVGWGGLVGLVGLACPPDRRRLVVLPALLVLLEWFLWHAPFGGVPLSTLAMTQARGPMLPVARIGGALLLGAAVSAVGSATYLALRRRWRPALAVTGTVAAVALVGLVWPQGTPVARIRVAGVQGGGPQGTRFDASQTPVVFRRQLEATRRIPPGSVDLVVWPENTVNVDGRFASHPWARELAAEAARIGAPIVVGVVEDTDDPGAFANFVVVVNPDGSLTDRYDKERRVPFGEYVPLRDLLAPVAGAALPARDQVPGVGTAMVRTDAGPMAVVISWEVFFGRRVREGVRAGGEVVLNPTNGSSYWLTIVQSQQIATSQLRAVEAGRWLVQVAPTGFSAFVDPDGRVLDRTGVSEQQVITRRISRFDATTPAQALGELPALVIALGALALVAGGALRRSRGAPAGPSAPSHPEHPSDLEHHGDGSVVDEPDGHVGAEPAGRHVGTEPP